MAAERRVLVVAGEASGDRHGAGLVRAARALDPDLRFEGVGGRAMEEAGVSLRQDAARMGVVGLAEVLRSLPLHLRTLRELRGILRDRPPSLCVLIDYPDFNLSLARTARAVGVPVLYFVSPQVWAWRRGRIRTIARRVDRMLVLFPFEEALYREAGVPVEFVGHPLADEIPGPADREACRGRLGIEGEGPVVGLLPGSRQSEVERHLEPLLLAAERVSRSRPGAVFLLPVATTLNADSLRERVAARGGPPVRVLEGAFDEVVGACDVAAVASGTATLEVALRRVPLVVFYRTSPLTHSIARWVVRLPHVSLVNLVAEREVAPELIQRDFTPERLAGEIERLLDDDEARREALASLEEVAARLRGEGAYPRAAEILVAMSRGEEAPPTDGRPSTLEEPEGA
jgi:lipid-A-disaccharide synthase